jgi:hypothetical protein
MRRIGLDPGKLVSKTKPQLRERPLHMRMQAKTRQYFA